MYFQEEMVQFFLKKVALRNESVYILQPIWAMQNKIELNYMKVINRTSFHDLLCSLSKNSHMLQFSKKKYLKVWAQIS